MSENLKKASTTDELARERNRAAADRTLMAWIRTALSLIAFGFSIGKIAEYLKKANPDRMLDPIDSARIFGEAFIALGIFGLIAAIIQHRRIVQQIKRGEFVYTEHLPLAMITAIILLLIGVFGFVAVLL
jgi:putative membrane protein